MSLRTPGTLLKKKKIFFHGFLVNILRVRFKKFGMFVFDLE
jgi:hypothetical protein